MIGTKIVQLVLFIQTNAQRSEEPSIHDDLSSLVFIQVDVSIIVIEQCPSSAQDTRENSLGKV